MDARTLALALFLAVSAAFPGHGLRVDVDTTLQQQEVATAAVKIRAKHATLTAIDCPQFSVRGDTHNDGVMVFVTTKHARADLAGRIEYAFRGAFANTNTFVVQHDSPVPLRVKVRGHAPSVNDGLMVFAGRSLAPVLGGQALRLRISYQFVNEGSIAIAGLRTASTTFRLESALGAEMVRGFPRTWMANAGVIYVQRAVLTHEIHMVRGSGCIALGPGGSLYTNANFIMEQQQIYFAPGSGSAAVVVLSHGARRNARYTVMNFPRGARIVLERHLTRMAVSSHDLYVFSSLDPAERTVAVQFVADVDRTRVRFADGVLSYDGDARCAFVPRNCAKVRDVRRAAAPYMDGADVAGTWGRPAARNVPG